MDISTLRKGDVLALEVEVTDRSDRSVSPDGWVQLADVVALDGDELDKMNAKVVRRGPRPVKSGDYILTTGGPTLRFIAYAPWRDFPVVVDEPASVTGTNGYLAEVCTHKDGTPILWEES